MGFGATEIVRARSCQMPSRNSCHACLGREAALVAEETARVAWVSALLMVPPPARVTGACVHCHIHDATMAFLRSRLSCRQTFMTSGKSAALMARAPLERASLAATQLWGSSSPFSVGSCGLVGLVVLSGARKLQDCSVFLHRDGGLRNRGPGLQQTLKW